MVERIVFMQIEDNMVSFERENGDTIIYPKDLIPSSYTNGDIIKVIVHSEDEIEFLELDTEEMERRRLSLIETKSRLRARAIRSTNKA